MEYNWDNAMLEMHSIYQAGLVDMDTAVNQCKLIWYILYFQNKGIEDDRPRVYAITA